MTKTKIYSLCFALTLIALSTTGCDGNTGVVEAPVRTAEEVAASEARQAEYSKSMQESYGKKKGR